MLRKNIIFILEEVNTEDLREFIGDSAAQGSSGLRTVVRLADSNAIFTTDSLHQRTLSSNSRLRALPVEQLKETELSESVKTLINSIVEEKTKGLRSGKNCY